MALKKSLSQHLLKDKNLLNKLVRLAEIGPDDVVVEIGAGRGDLTRCLIPHARFVYAIELDRLPVDLGVDELAQRLAGRSALGAAAGHEGELGRVGQADLERLALLQPGPGGAQLGRHDSSQSMAARQA